MERVGLHGRSACRGAAKGMLENITTVPEALGYTSEMAACVTEDDDENAGDLF